MSGPLDDVLNPAFGAAGPIVGAVVGAYNALVHAAGKVFGTGQTPGAVPPPPALPPVPSTAGSGPAQQEIDRLNEMIVQLQQQIAQAHQTAVAATDDSADNSNQGRQTNDGILADGNTTGGLLAPQQGTPEGEAAALQAMQRQIDALTANIQDKADHAGTIADTLRNLGAAIPGMGTPGMGMPPLGMPGLGMPALPQLGGLGAPQVTPVSTPAPPVVSAHPTEDPQRPPQVRSTAPELAPTVDKPATTTPTPVTSLIPPGEPAPALAPPVPAPPAGPPTPTPPATKPAATAPVDGTRITLPSGQVVTAPNEAAAAAVRTAIEQPAGHGDVATTAYSGTGVSIPTDGAEPGRKIDPADLAPGDIAVFDDHTALVAGNGQLVDADGKLQPLGVINDATNFHGFFRPTETTDIPAAVVSPHDPAGVSASTPHTTTAAPIPAAATLSGSPSQAPSPTPDAAPSTAPAAPGSPVAGPPPMPLGAATAATKPAPAAPSPASSSDAHVR